MNEWFTEDALMILCDEYIINVNDKVKGYWDDVDLFVIIHVKCVKSVTGWSWVMLQWIKAGQEMYSL